MRTNNSPGATGDGYILAYEAGARLQDIEFIQFLPATLIGNSTRLFLHEAFIEGGAVFKISLEKTSLVGMEYQTPKR